MIIDEISQVPMKLYKLIEDAIRLGVQVLISGDFKQILPVGESVNGLDFLKVLCGNYVQMTKYKRGDAELLDALTRVRNREGLPFEKGTHGNLHFCFTKARRDAINQTMMKSLTGLETRSTVLPVLAIGMPLRSNKTSKEGWLNGERWTVEAIEPMITLKSMMRDKTVVLDKAEVLESFMPGYAMTIHSSQGLTIEEDYTVHFEKHTLFDKDTVWRMLYTALSRAKRLSQVRVNMA